MPDMGFSHIISNLINITAHKANVWDDRRAANTA